MHAILICRCKPYAFVYMVNNLCSLSAQLIDMHKPPMFGARNSSIGSSSLQLPQTMKHHQILHLICLLELKMYFSHRSCYPFACTEHTITFVWFEEWMGRDIHIVPMFFHRVCGLQLIGRCLHELICCSILELALLPNRYTLLRTCSSPCRVQK